MQTWGLADAPEHNVPMFVALATIQFATSMRLNKRVRARRTFRGGLIKWLRHVHTSRRHRAQNNVSRGGFSEFDGGGTPTYHFLSCTCIQSKSIGHQNKVSEGRVHRCRQNRPHQPARGLFDTIMVCILLGRGTNDGEAAGSYGPMRGRPKPWHVATVRDINLQTLTTSRERWMILTSVLLLQRLPWENRK